MYVRSMSHSSRTASSAQPRVVLPNILKCISDRGNGNMKCNGSCNQRETTAVFSPKLLTLETRMSTAYIVRVSLLSPYCCISSPNRNKYQQADGTVNFSSFSLIVFSQCASQLPRLLLSPSTTTYRICCIKAPNPSSCTSAQQSKACHPHLAREDVRWRTQKRPHHVCETGDSRRTSFRVGRGVAPARGNAREDTRERETMVMGGDAPRLTQFLSDEELTELVSAFPAVEFAFAYGSGVVHQKASTHRFGSLTSALLARLRKAASAAFSCRAKNGRLHRQKAVQLFRRNPMVQNKLLHGPFASEKNILPTVQTCAPISAWV